jgi:NADH:ubiquinone reductase (H+-translocating)
VPLVHFDVVIVGGGFAGAHAARALVKALGREQATRRVALIAERNVLVFHPMLAEVAGASLNPADVVNPLRQYCRGVTVLQGAVTEVDLKARCVTVDGGRFTRDQVIGFRHLALALGSVTDLSRVPGMAEHGWPLKGVADALRLRAAVINRLEEANLVGDHAVRKRLLTFVVVGGGYTGVEVAGQIHDLIKEAMRFYTRLREDQARVVLVHGGGQLLAEIGPKLGEYAAEVLRERGIEILLETRVAEATASRVSFESGEAIETHTIVSTIGNAPSPVVLDTARQLGLEPERGRMPTEPNFRVRGQREIWAAGDCAATPWEDRGEVKTAPPTAQFAQRAGKQMGQNIGRVLVAESERATAAEVDAALHRFRYRYRGQLASIGARQAVAELMGVHFRGFFAWCLWRMIYLSKLPGMMRKLRVTIDWTFEAIFARDISVVLPPASDTMRLIHLEPGEPMARRGDPVRAVGYLRRGRLEARAADGSLKQIAEGQVVDHEWADGDGRWKADLVATESSDLTLFRGRALELFTGELRLAPGVARAGRNGAGGAD